MAEAVDARDIVHVLRTVQAGFPDPTDILDATALSYCAWNKLIAEVGEHAVVTAEGARFLDSIGQLYPAAGPNPACPVHQGRQALDDSDGFCGDPGPHNHGAGLP